MVTVTVAVALEVPLHELLPVQLLLVLLVGGVVGAAVGATVGAGVEVEDEAGGVEVGGVTIPPPCVDERILLQGTGAQSLNARTLK